MSPVPLPVRCTNAPAAAAAAAAAATAAVIEAVVLGCQAAHLDFILVTRSLRVLAVSPAVQVIAVAAGFRHAVRHHDSLARGKQLLDNVRRVAPDLPTIAIK
jgi:hypothetical protein